MKYPNAHLIRSEASDIEKAVFELMMAILANMPPSVYSKEIPGSLITRKMDGCTYCKTAARLLGTLRPDIDHGIPIGLTLRYEPSIDDHWQHIELIARHGDKLWHQNWAIFPGQALTDVDWSKNILDTANTCRVIYTILHDLPKFIDQLTHGIKAHEAQSAPRG